MPFDGVPNLAEVLAAGGQLLDDELIIDYFAGGGGASTGLEQAFGRSPDVAKNHDPEACALHLVNHPETLHLCENVWTGDPRDVQAIASRRRCTRLGRAYRLLPIGVWWFSPDCKHFSKAKGSVPVEKGIRDLAWVVVHCAKLTRPRIIMLENVEEFKEWSPLVRNAAGQLVPDKLSKGKTFKRWVRALRRLGYTVEWRELRANDYGAPTIRKRLFVVARLDGLPILWPQPSHAKEGDKRLPAYRTAAECIDWTIPVPSIFGRTKMLADNTHRRTARGLIRYVISSATPFIVGVGGRMGQSPERPVTASMQTVTAKADSALVQPFIARVDQTSAAGRNGIASVAEALRTIHTSNPFALVNPIVATIDHQSTRDTAKPVAASLSAITGKNRHVLIVPHVTKFRGGATGSGIDEPVPTITANSFIKRPGGAPPLGLVSAVLPQRYGEREGQDPRARPVDQPMATVTPTQNGASLAVAFMAQHNTDNDGHPMDKPVSTIVGKGCTQGLAAAMLSHAYTSNTAGGQGDPTRPMKTILTGGHHALVKAELGGESVEDADMMVAFVGKYYGTNVGLGCDEPMHTVTTRDRFAVVEAVVRRPPLDEDERYGARGGVGSMRWHLSHRFDPRACALAAGGGVV